MLAVATGLPLWPLVPVLLAAGRAMARPPELSGKDAWGRPMAETGMQKRDSRAYRRAKAWFSKPMDLLPSGPDMLAGLAMGGLAALTVRHGQAWGAPLSFLAMYLTGMGWMSLRRDHRLDMEPAPLVLRRVTWARKRLPMILLGALPGLAAGILLWAGFGLWQPLFPLMGTGMLMPMIPALRQARRQDRDDLESWRLLDGWLAQLQKPPVRPPDRVTGTRKGNNGERLFVIHAGPQGSLPWTNASIRDLLKPLAAEQGMRVGVVSHGTDPTRAIVALRPEQSMDPMLQLADPVGLEARCDVDIMRMCACYPAIPGAARLAGPLATRGGKPCAWGMDIVGGNATWGDRGSQWFTDRRDEWGRFLCLDGLETRMDPSNRFCWILADADWDSMDFDEAKCLKIIGEERPPSPPMRERLARIDRQARDRTEWEHALEGSKLNPPAGFLYSTETRATSPHGWSITSIQLSVGKSDGQATDYMKPDLRPAFGDALIADILPIDGAGRHYARYMMFCRAGRDQQGMPTQLRDLTGDDQAARLLARILASRAFATGLKHPALVGPAQNMAMGDDWCLWRMPVVLTGGVTPGDVRRAQSRLDALMGADTTLWQWVDAGRLVLWAGTRIAGDPAQWRDQRQRTKALALAWGQAWAEAGACTKDGRTPTVETAERQGVFDRIEFKAPPGLSGQDLLDRLERFQAAAGFAYAKSLPVKGSDRTLLLLGRDDPLPARADADWTVLDPERPWMLPFGVRDDGEPAWLDTHDTPHLLATGTTGSGKSSVSVTIVQMALRLGWTVLAADPSKGCNDLRPIRRKLAGFADTLEDTAALTRWTVVEMRRRVQLIKNHGGGDLDNLPADVRPERILLYVAEFNSLLQKDRRKLDNPQEDPDVANENTRIEWANGVRSAIGLDVSVLLRQARSAGIILLLDAQQLNASQLDLLPDAGACKAMLGRVFLGNGEPAGNVDQMSVKEAHRLIRQTNRTGGFPKGRGMYQPLGRPLDMFQAWWGGKGGELEANCGDLPDRRPVDAGQYRPVPPRLVGVMDQPVVEQASMPVSVDLGEGDDDEWIL